MAQPFYMAQDIANKYLSDKKILILVIFLLSCLLSYYLFGPNLQAKWWVIDDHEIMSFFGADGKTTILEIPKLFYNSHDKPFNIGKSIRFRPTYYFLRIWECFFWGRNPFFWYLSHYLMATISIAIFFFLVYQYLGLILSAVFTTYTFSFPFWSDIWSRLGPSEIYAVFGTALYCLCFFNLIKKDTNYSKINALLLSFGAIIAIGSKENLLLLVVPTGYLLYNLIRGKRLTITTIISIFLIFIFAFYVGTSVFLALKNGGVDVYENPVNLSYRIQILKQAFKTRSVFLLIISSLIIANISFFLKEKYIFLFKKRLFVASFGILLLVALYISQYIFYNGKWPTGMRYDFPGILYKPLFLIIITCLILETQKIFFVYCKKYNYLILLSIIIVTSLFYFPKRLKAIRIASINNLNRTTCFTHNLENIIETVKKTPDNFIVFESHNLWDYERIFSLERFFLSFGVKNPLILRLHAHSGENGLSDLEKKLSTSLDNLSQYGGSISFKSIKQLQLQKKYFSVQLSGETYQVCENLREILE